jgi:AcrR family transcriptional regulator
VHATDDNALLSSVPAIETSRPRGLARGKQSTREALLDAVEELLAERGWMACSLQAVTRRAGLTTGAVYSTFGSRGALLAAAMMRRTEANASLPVDEPDLTKAVMLYASNYWSATQNDEGVQLVTLQLDLMRLANDDPSIADALGSAYEGLIATMVADFDTRGFAVQGVTTLDAVRRLVGVLQGLTLQNVAFDAQIGEAAFVAAALAAVGAGPRRGR